MIARESSPIDLYRESHSLEPLFLSLVALQVKSVEKALRLSTLRAKQFDELVEVHDLFANVVVQLLNSLKVHVCRCSLDILLYFSTTSSSSCCS